MSAIGGYFELELAKGNFEYHTTRNNYKSGRSALTSILSFLKPSNVYVPFYGCQGVTEPFEAAEIPFGYYAIDPLLEPVNLPELGEREYFLYINYFDCKRDVVNLLSGKYKDRLIVDNTQAFYQKGNNRSWFFNTCRKFFGVPDGAYVYAPEGVSLPVAASRHENYRTDHLIKRFNGHPQEGYSAFQENEQLCDCEITGMSKLSEYLLSNVDYENVANVRRANYNYLAEIFGSSNMLKISPVAEGVPMCYPLMTETAISREKFYSSKVFIPYFWKEILTRSETGFDLEKNVVQKLLPLPVDQRYDLTDMRKMSDLIKQFTQPKKTTL